MASAKSLQRLSRARTPRPASTFHPIVIQHDQQHKLIRNEMEEFTREFECADTPVIRKIQLAAKYNLFTDKELLWTLTKVIECMDAERTCHHEQRRLSKFLVNRDDLNENQLIVCLNLLKQMYLKIENRRK